MTPRTNSFRLDKFATAAAAAGQARDHLSTAAGSLAPTQVFDSADAALEALVEAVASLGVAMAQDPAQYLTDVTDKARMRINELVSPATTTPTTEEPA